MKDQTLTNLMLKSLKQDSSLAKFDDWVKAGDYAASIRFFPHAFNCYQNAYNLGKTELNDKNIVSQFESVAEKLNTVLDKITNVLEIVPDDLAEMIEDIRFNQPLDPNKWLAISNELLRQEKFDAGKVALAFTSYCVLRLNGDVAPINEVLSGFISEPQEEKVSSESKKINIGSSSNTPLRVVAFGDNITLGLQKDWEINQDETYHHVWAKESDAFVTVANCGVSGAGILDAFLYLKRDVVNYKPDLVFLNFGINDAWLGKEALPAFEILYEVVLELLKPHAQIVVIGPVPHIPEACPADQRPTEADLSEVEIIEWERVVRKVAQNAGVAYADVCSKFPGDPASRKKLFANGFNQLNLEGNKLIVQAINEVLNLV